MPPGGHHAPIAACTILIVPTSVLSALVNLAAKNAILIVGFVKPAEERGGGPVEAMVKACRLHLRPILMTAFAFILGVVPFAIVTGAGTEMRQALGVTVFSGMPGVTFFGLFLTPDFDVVLRSLFPRRRTAAVASAHPAE